jgi:hypothetical protein
MFGSKLKKVIQNGANKYGWTIVKLSDDQATFKVETNKCVIVFIAVMHSDSFVALAGRLPGKVYTCDDGSNLFAAYLMQRSVATTASWVLSQEEDSSHFWYKITYPLDMINENVLTVLVGALAREIEELYSSGDIATKMLTALMANSN